MQIVEVKSIFFPEIKIIRFARFSDRRGFFSEVFKKSDFQKKEELYFLKNIEILQANISFSKKNVVRGLHFQWNPAMGKLIRIIQGKIIDLFLDVRSTSPVFGKIGAYEMSSDLNQTENQWIWIPPGFAHGVVFLEETILEYFCSTEYNPRGEETISPMAKDIDWSLCETKLKQIVQKIFQNNPIISDKDKKGHSLIDWKKITASRNI